MPDLENSSWASKAYAPAVGFNDIRRWAIATHWPDRPPRLFTDPHYAAQTRWGGVIAPRDFNPFTWLVEAEPRLPEETAAYHPDRPHVMNGGHADRYGAPIRPGDVICSTRRVISTEDRTTRLGPTRFITTEHQWTNQENEFVRLRTNTLIRYAS